MEFTSPKVFHLASTALNHNGVKDYLQEIKVPEWTTNAQSDGEALIEIGGKGCYKSFSLDLNRNLTRIREGDNENYIKKSIIETGHGSVLEHVHDTFALVGVSRILTHELVRHRIANYSQESLRFVRLTELRAYFPDAFKDKFLARIRNFLHEKGLGDLITSEAALRRRMQNVFELLEQNQLELANELRLDDLESFGDKKRLTSAMRRMAPMGLATAVMMTANLRQWRLIIEKRTNGAAEEEIRKATYDVFVLLSQRYRAVFADAQVEVVNDLPQVTFQHGCG